MQYNEVIEELLSLKDNKYLSFSKKLIFTNYEMIGIRTPYLRKLATRISKDNPYNYLDNLKRKYHEEILLEGFIIGKLENYNEFLHYFNNFIIYIDNWAICDMSISSMKIISKNKKLVLEEVKKYLSSDNEFIVRIAVIILMNYYLTDEYIDTVIELISKVDLDKYYVNMSISWLLSITYIKYQEKTYNLLKQDIFSKTIVNMTIQKIRDSKRVSDSDKEKITKLKRH